MQQLLKKQTDTLTKLEENAKQDKLIQIAQLLQGKNIDDDGDRLEEQLKELNKNVKTLNEKTGDSLNSNVIKLFKATQKATAGVARGLNDSETQGITDKVGERRQFNTLKPRVENFKAGVKDFFTMRGFLDKTGIVKRGSGGIVSEYLDRGEAKKNYIDQRMKTKGTTFGNEETFGKQFDEQQRIKGDMSKNEAEIKRLRDNGATDIGLKRGGYLDKRNELATEMAKVDPSMRPEGFDSKTGKIKEKAQLGEEGGPSAEIIKFPSLNGNSVGSSGSSTKEEMLEQNRMISDQTELLIKIEENTRGLSGKSEKDDKKQQDSDSGFSLSGLLGGKGRLGRIAKRAGTGLMSGAKAAGGFLLKKAAPLAAVGAVAAGAYTGYQGYSDAGDKQVTAKEEIKQKLASGEINEGEAAKLTRQANEQATEEKSSAVGEGTGSAVGGAAGALKGAAIGATIGSAVPIVGTVIGGALGATVGALGGSYLGGKIGKTIGSGFGKTKNFLFGGGSDEDESKKKENESKTKPKEQGPNYLATIKSLEPGFTPVSHLAKAYPGIEEKYIELAKNSAPRSDSQMAIHAHMKMLEAKAKQEITLINDADPGLNDKKSPGAKTVEKSPGAKTADALKKTAEGVSKNTGDNGPKGGPLDYMPTGKNVKDSHIMLSGEPVIPGQPLTSKQMAGVAMGKMNGKTFHPEIEKQFDVQGGNKQMDKEKLQPPVPAKVPASASTIDQKSKEVENEKMNAMAPNKSANTTVIAPSTNVNNNSTTTNIKSPIRNQDSTHREYFKNRYSY
jgi:hypothetical protein